MEEEKLDLTALQNSIGSFNEALQEYQSNENDLIKGFIRDSCIQRFEYCYDLSAKMLRKHLMNIADTPSDVKEYSFQKLIRQAYDKGLLLHSYDKWSEYRDSRNKTSHGYNKNMAISIVREIPHFYKELDHLLNKLIEYYENQV